MKEYDKVELISNKQKFKDLGLEKGNVDMEDPTLF